MTPAAKTELLQALQEIVPEAKIIENAIGNIVLQVELARLFATLRKLRDREDFSFDLLADITAIDRGASFSIVYQLHSLTRKTEIEVQSEATKEGAVVESASCLWGSALFGEREVADMFGIRFDGHPDLRPLLAPEEGFPFFPLRKDFKLDGR